MIASSLLIVASAPGLPHRTKRGNMTLRQWMGFRNYLTSKTLVKKDTSTEFFEYLPYAIVLGCEQEWIARWQEHTILLPNWYSSNKTFYTAEEYGHSLVDVIDYLAKSLVAARPPDVA
jgi:uncharacterized membrane protein